MASPMEVLVPCPATFKNLSGYVATSFPHLHLDGAAVTISSLWWGQVGSRAAEVTAGKADAILVN